MTTQHVPNRLAKEKSPYLLQHAHNPVDWYSWSEEAFEKAERENKPIFLSIGYSTCHWCHVMERESFEDEEVAALLNAHFVAVKVDREERPDVDHVYMSVCQAMTGQGGWPLTVLLAPDRTPFLAGTYYPKRRKYGRVGLMELLAQVGEKWAADPEGMAAIGRQVADETRKQLGEHSSGKVQTGLLPQAYELYSKKFEARYGGFGRAPKFPSSHNLSFLLRYHFRTGEAHALEMVEHTLQAMHRGGMYDHVGFGFARYSTDEKWLVPHFEKMLYDNALLAMTFTEAYQITGKALYARVVDEIFSYVLRDMTNPEGGFYSAEDADSEGEEGLFYVWSPREITEVLGEEDGALYCSVYDITSVGNFEGHSIPNLIGAVSLEHAAQERGMDPLQLKERMEECRRKLFSYREKRVHPHKDDKILTAWNGLMIMALSKGAKALNRRDYADAAERAAAFLMTKLRREDGRLLARYRDGEAAYLGYLDDYAFLVWGLIELYEATFKLEYLKEALALNEEMLRLFWDEEEGGLFFNGSDGEKLITRPKELYDGAMPSGNSVAAHNLVRLARLTGSDELTQRAEAQLKAFAGTVMGYPPGFSMYLLAADLHLYPGREAVVAGTGGAVDTEALASALRQHYRPDTSLMLHPAGAEEEAEALLPLTVEKLPVAGKAAVYICENFSCQAPVTDAEQLVP